MKELELSRKVKLGIFPTPTHWARRFPNVIFKRDDLSGFSFGGNKVRCAEYIMARTLENKSTHLIMSGNVYSNYVRIVSTACRHFGIEPVLISYGNLPISKDANWKIISSLVSDIRFTGKDARDSVDQLAIETSKDLSLRGHNPEIIERGGASALAALGYVSFVEELETQIKNLGIQSCNIVLPIGSGCTIAGIWAGINLRGLPWKVYGICTSRSVAESLQVVDKVSREIFLSMQTESVQITGTLSVLDEWNSEGYSKWGERLPVVIKEALINEGIELDPVFTGKAYLALIDLLGRSPEFKQTTSIFLHCGGQPNIFMDRLAFI